MGIGSFPHQVTRLVFDTGQPAPHGFLILWRLGTTPVMSLAGNPTRCTAYLMGNHTIAEQMYRHDPAIMQYVPPRTVIYAGPDDRAFFAADQPSTQVAIFSLAPVTQAGTDLDRKLTTLLRALDIPAGKLDGPA
jgi:hypothetical protein